MNSTESLSHASQAGVAAFKAATTGVVLDPMLSITAVCTATNLGKSSVHAYVKAKVLPAPYRVGARRVAWKASEIQAYLDALPRVGAGQGNAQ